MSWSVRRSTVVGFVGRKTRCGREGLSNVDVGDGRVLVTPNFENIGRGKGRERWTRPLASKT